MIDWLPSIQGHRDDDIVYPIDEIRKQFEVREICRDGYLVLNWNDHWLKFAVLEFYSSDANGGNVELSCVFHGEGPSANLRECRHTYWGDGGYIFYPNGAIIAAAFKELAEFYDEMVLTSDSDHTDRTQTRPSLGPQDRS